MGANVGFLGKSLCFYYGFVTGVRLFTPSCTPVKLNDLKLHPPGWHPTGVDTYPTFDRSSCEMESIRTPHVGKASARPPKPYPDFPLFPHRTGYWAKKIRGKQHYFGAWGRQVDGKIVSLPDHGWKTALDEYQRVKDDLQSGRAPRDKTGDLTVRDLCNRFLTYADAKVRSGEMVQRTWDDYKRVCDRITRVLGLTTVVEQLQPDDFAALRADIAKNRGVVALGNEITRARVVFNFAFKNLLVSAPVKYGLSFQRPTKKTMRQAKAANGPKMLEPNEVHQLLGRASIELRAMILLALNGGFGNSDCAKLPISALDLNARWINYPRPKTGIARRCPLWRETVDALQAVLKRRLPDRQCVFVTARGNSFEKNQSSITHQFRKLLVAEGLHRTGVGFYTLRHVFRTIADGCRDQVAIDHIMGHADSSMGANYRQRIDDDRLLAVAGHVHGWLFEYREGRSNG